jgi:hypothetical protein
MDPEYVPETLVPNGDGTFNSGLAFNMGPQLNEVLTSIPKNTEILNKLKNNGAFEFEFPSSTYPELNFMSLHNDKSNTKIRLTTGQDGALKAEIITDVLTKLKGLDKNKLTIRDEFFIHPESSQIIDSRTGLPLDQIQKTYYKGNELNWYNQSGTLPFTNKFGKGLNLAEYPQVISADPLKQTPGTRRNAAWNMIGKPLLFSPYVLPFSYPGFAARNKFYPESKKVTIDYFGRQRELGPQAPGGMTFGDQPFGTQYADYTLQANRNYRTGRNFMIGAGLLGAGIGGASLYYNRDTGDMEVDAEDLDYKGPNGQKPGFGFKFDLNSFGRNKPTRAPSDNNYGLDSMYINNGDTLNDKGWGAPAPDYKYGGSHKKKFLKRMQQMFEPGGETQDPSLGKGSRMDNFNNEVSKKKNWISVLKKESDKVANEELYKLVQKSGDPKLMNIFMGDQQQGQPQDNQIMQQPQFSEEGGNVDMSMSDPLTRFVYGGDEYDNPDYYEPNDLIEARNGGISRPDMMTYPEWYADQTSSDNWPGAYSGNEPDDNQFSTDPAEEGAYNTWYDQWSKDNTDAEAKRFQDYRDYMNFYNEDEEDELDNSGNQNTHNCDPGFKWVEEYQTCVPIMQTKYRPNIVPNNSGFLDNILPWNRRRNAGYTKKQKSNPYYLEGRNPYTGQLSGPPIASYVTKRGIFGRPKKSLDIYNVGTGGVDVSELLELAKQNQRGNKTNEKDDYRARIPKKVHEKKYTIRRLFAKDPGRDKHRASLFPKKAGRDNYRASWFPKKLKD